MTDTAMAVVKHPTLDVKYSVPEADTPRWVAQGWSVTDDAPSSPPGAALAAPQPTVAQELGIGLLPVAGEEPAAEPAAETPEPTPEPEQPSEDPTQ